MRCVALRCVALCVRGGASCRRHTVASRCGWHWPLVPRHSCALVCCVVMSCACPFACLLLSRTHRCCRPLASPKLSTWCGASAAYPGSQQEHHQQPQQHQQQQHQPPHRVTTQSQQWAAAPVTLLGTGVVTLTAPPHHLTLSSAPPGRPLAFGSCGCGACVLAMTWSAVSWCTCCGSLGLLGLRRALLCWLINCFRTWTTTLHACCSSSPAAVDSLGWLDSWLVVGARV